MVDTWGQLYFRDGLNRVTAGLVSDFRVDPMVDTGWAVVAGGYSQ
jgi:hypothetical protein